MAYRPEITTIGAIDCNKAQRAKRRKTAKRLKMAARRKIAGRQPSVSSMRPWEARGISRATWYRRGKPAGNETARQIPYPADRTHMLGTELSHQASQRRDAPPNPALAAPRAATKAGPKASHDGDARLTPLAVFVVARQHRPIMPQSWRTGP
jgi:hypothetical protein